MLLRKSFQKHVPERYLEYMESLVKGETTIKSTGLQPHEIVSKVSHSALDETLEAQWKDMIEKIKKSGGLNGVLSIVDVSGSMSGQPMDVAIALGLLASEVTVGPFHHKLVTFSATPTLQTVEGETLRDKVQFTQRMHWQTNTNFCAVFDLLLSHATMYSVSPDKMPKTLLCLSDMQFDVADGSASKVTTFEGIKEKYKKAGYEMPLLVFWNLSSYGAKTTGKFNFPVSKHESGAVLLSGFSGELLKLFMNNNPSDITPERMLHVAVDKYECEVID
jgi:hypothetical protein